MKNIRRRLEYVIIYCILVIEMILLRVLTCLLPILYVFCNKQNDELVFKHLEEQYKENIQSHPLVGKTTIYIYIYILKH
jgi:hypothetical protein